MGWPGVEPTLGGSGQSRPFPNSIILYGFFAPSFPADTIRSRPFPTAPLENVKIDGYAPGLTGTRFGVNLSYPQAGEPV